MRCQPSAGRVLCPFSQHDVATNAWSLPPLPSPSPARQAGYRAALPAPAWCAYLLRAAPAPAAARLAAAAYLALKAAALLRRARLLLTATRLALRTGALYGRYLAGGELAGGGAPAECPICRDAPRRGVRLDCSHVFCEDCLAEWLEREATCPLCRCNVKPRGLEAFGDGSTTLLPQLF
ncbi:MAG: hypothetical protein J3K34DRAFT_285766 [Monoraphidium minutum]|nr:MAG: hypothetical protein J3K34DRAFT_285766 [Monoraphidium minutum]